MEPSFQFRQLIHPLAVEVCRTLQNAGYQAFIVGGCVRDLVLGQIPKDWDITTDATPEKVMELFQRTIPTGLQHGTVTICMAEGVENHFEVTTFRVEGKYLDGRRPEEVKFVKNLNEDLSRRDLTINAMAFDPINNALLDPFGGYNDILLGMIRAVGEPQARFQEDGLRIMRAARFSARFGFAIHEKTYQGMIDSLDTLKKVSKERISDELCKTLMTDHPSAGIMYLVMCGAMYITCPSMSKHFTLELGKVDQCKGELETRLAYLYADTPIDLVKEELFSLKLSNKEIQRVCFLLDSLYQYTKGHMSRGYSEFIARFKNDAPDAWDHTLGQFIELGRARGMQVQEWLDLHKDTVVYSRKELSINGNDLMELGIKPGPNLKSLLDGCYKEILVHPEHNNKEFLLKLMKLIKNN